MYLIYIYPSIYLFIFLFYFKNVFITHKYSTLLSIQIGKKPVSSGMHYIKFILQFIDISGEDK